MTTTPVSVPVAFKNILFATDFSPVSEAALPFLLSLARCYDSKIIVAHAVPTEAMVGITPSPPAADIDQEWQAAKNGMQRYQDTHDFSGLRHEFVLER